MMDEQKLLAELARPFAPDMITWKPGTAKESRCLALTYADLRAYMERLDEVCGLNWSVAYEPWGDNRIIARLTIHGVTRSSTGEYGTQDEKNGIAGTVAEAQALKRAAAMFGLGRYLYDYPTGWVDYDPKARRITDAAHKTLLANYTTWYKRETAQKPVGTTQGGAKVESRAPVPANEDVDSLGDELFGKDATPEPWYVAARRNLTNGTAALADKMLDIHRNGAGPCSDKQYQYLSGLIDSLPGVGKDGHAKVLSVICQSEISSANRPSFDLATKLLDYLPTHTKVDGNKVANPNYRADVVEHITKIANALQMALPLVA